MPFVSFSKDSITNNPVSGLFPNSSGEISLWNVDKNYYFGKNNGSIGITVEPDIWIGEKELFNYYGFGQGELIHYNIIQI